MLRSSEPQECNLGELIYFSTSCCPAVSFERVDDENTCDDDDDDETRHDIEQLAYY